MLKYNGTHLDVIVILFKSIIFELAGTVLMSKKQLPVVATVG